MHLSNGFRRSLSSFLFVLGCAPAWASDIQCESTQQSAERVICDHAILDSQYDDIFGQQQNLLASRKVTPDELASWRQERDACSDVLCIDGVFANWKAIAKAAEDRNRIRQSPSTGGVQQRQGNASRDEGNPSFSTSQALPSTPPDSTSATATVKAAGSKSGNSDSSGAGGFVLLAGFIFLAIVKKIFGRSTSSDSGRDGMRVGRTEQRARASDASRDGSFARGAQNIDNKRPQPSAYGSSGAKPALTTCRYCGSRSYGGGCTRSPHRHHEHNGDETKCEFCGSQSYGGGCSFSPSHRHRHGSSGGKCRWCGSKSYGGGCSFSPNKVHEH